MTAESAGIWWDAAARWKSHGEKSGRAGWEARMGKQNQCWTLPHKSTIHQKLVDIELNFPVGDIQNILFSLLEDSAYYSQLPVAQYGHYRFSGERR